MSKFKIIIRYFLTNCWLMQWKSTDKIVTIYQLYANYDVCQSKKRLEGIMMKLCEMSIDELISVDYSCNCE